MKDNNLPRLIIYNERDAPLAIFHVDKIHVSIDSATNIEVCFEESTVIAIRKGRVNMALLHMPNRVYKVDFNFLYDTVYDTGYISKGDEITINNVLLPL